MRRTRRRSKQPAAKKKKTDGDNPSRGNGNVKSRAPAGAKADRPVSNEPTKKPKGRTAPKSAGKLRLQHLGSPVRFRCVSCRRDKTASQAAMTGLERTQMVCIPCYRLVGYGRAMAAKAARSSAEPRHRPGRAGGQEWQGYRPKRLSESVDSSTSQHYPGCARHQPHISSAPRSPPSRADGSGPHT